DGVSGLAYRLAVSERHLHRELVAEVGVGPLELARSRRAQTARLLIDQTDLSLTTIAFAAGFASVRQFNDSMQAAFGCAPSAFRRREPSVAGGNGHLTLRLPYRPPYDAASLLAFLGQRALPGVEEVRKGRYRRTIALPHTKGILEIEPVAEKNHLLMRMHLDDLRDLNLLVQRCRQLFDLDADPAVVADVLAADPLLAPLLSIRPGLRVPGAINGFELAVRAILGQQVSVAGARTLAGRLVKSLGEPLRTPDGTLTHLFPVPEVVANADLQGLGITQRRIDTMRLLAQNIVSGILVLDRGAEREQTMTQLLALPGVGPWTVSYIAMRALGDPDAFPATDLGLRSALAQHGLATDSRHVTAYAEAWRPWRSYATIHLWTRLADAQGKQEKH
ncbi:MAG TPA: DNA-3-methyladenine glycosylase 2, partial [Ktedonobacteraceae bacterium]